MEGRGEAGRRVGWGRGAHSRGRPQEEHPDGPPLLVRVLGTSLRPGGTQGGVIHSPREAGRAAGDAVSDQSQWQRRRQQQGVGVTRLNVKRLVADGVPPASERRREIYFQEFLSLILKQKKKIKQPNC